MAIELGMLVFSVLFCSDLFSVFRLPVCLSVFLQLFFFFLCLFATTYKSHTATAATSILD